MIPGEYYLYLPTAIQFFFCKSNTLWSVLRNIIPDYIPAYVQGFLELMRDSSSRTQHDMSYSFTPACEYDVSFRVKGTCHRNITNDWTEYHGHRGHCVLTLFSTTPLYRFVHVQSSQMMNRYIFQPQHFAFLLQCGSVCSFYSRFICTRL